MSLTLKAPKAGSNAAKNLEASGKSTFYPAKTSSSVLQKTSVSAPTSRATSNSPSAALVATKTPIAQTPTVSQARSPSVAGGFSFKDRIFNVGNYLSYGLFGSPLPGYTVNPDHRVTILEKIAAHPFIVAGVAAVGATALGIGATAGTATGAAGAAATGAASSAGILGKLVPFGAGVAAGAILGGGGSGGDATTGPISQTPTQNTNTSQNTNYNTYTNSDSSNRSKNTIIGSPGASISGVTGAPSINQNPSQTATPIQSTEADSAAAGGSSSGGIGLAIAIAAIALAVSR